MALALVLLPLAMSALAAALPFERGRPWLLPATAAGHLALALAVIARGEAATGPGWLALDPPGRIVLLVVSALFLLCSVYAVGYLRWREERSNRWFCACLLAVPGLLSLVACAQHLGLMWIGLESATLATAPLIYFNRTPRSIEATWKYLVVGSVGVALALLGTFFLAYSSRHQRIETSLTFADLVQQAPLLSKPWLHAGFILLLVGYGTKMGLAPMHTWKPDAYGEAPGVVGALLAGGVTNCAFLAVVRVHHLCGAAGEGEWAARLLLPMGLFSMIVAGVFMVGQRDIKRLLAWSSVEHMGILVVGLAIGGSALFGTLLHVVTNGLTKVVLFLSAGNIHRAYASKSTDQVSGALRRLPWSGALFLVAFLAITGSPPFGPFVSEFAILGGAFESGRFVTAALFLLLLMVVFVGMGTAVLRVVQGAPPADGAAEPYRDDVLTLASPLLAMALVLLLGLWLPAPLGALLDDGVRFLEHRP